MDDDALVLMNTVAMLEDLGHTAFEAYSAKEALDILWRDDSVDLVITDQAMPKLTKPYLQRDLAEASVRINAQPRKGNRVVPLRSAPGRGQRRRCGLNGHPQISGTYPEMS